MADMFRRKTHRRDFLKGKSAAQALGDWTHGTEAAAETEEDAASADAKQEASPAQGKRPAVHPTAVRPAPLRTGPVIMKLGRPMMACEFEVALDPFRVTDVHEVAEEALDVIAEVEDQLTVYRESEVTRLNAVAAGGPTPVTDDLFELVRRCVELSRETDGAFDITTGPLTKVWGFYRRQGAMPSPEAVQEALARTGAARLLLDEGEKTIAFDRSGVEINFGGIGKGYALDMAAERLIAAGVGDFLMHGGMSSVLARGSRRLPNADGATNADKKQAGWTITLKSPLIPTQSLAELRLTDQAVGTAGAAFQSFTHRGKRYGHILDPRTGWPAEGVLSATAITESAADADALATAFYVLGPEKTAEFIANRPEVSALLCLAGQSRKAARLIPINLGGKVWRTLQDSAEVDDRWDAAASSKFTRR